MNLNNFVVLPNKPKSVKLNVRNLRELRIETALLNQDNNDMENRLHQLREVMSREKEERDLPVFSYLHSYLEKAYDRVPREELWYCMRKSGVAEKYVRVVQDMYERSRTVVRCAVGQTEEFNVEVGLHQGLALSPFLFAIVMDQLSEEVRQESPWTMMFADDIVICSESREQVEENLERWRFALERRGMKVSRSKTEYMCVNEREGSGTVRLQGEEVKKVQEFKYLGSTVQSNGECGKEVKKRVQAGWNGWRKVSGVLCDQKISARIKGKVYRTVVRPAMLYGLETVSLRKRQESELEVAELKMLRKNGAFHWKSAQTEYGTRDKEKKPNNKSSPSKMRIKVLKDEPLPGLCLELICFKGCLCLRLQRMDGTEHPGSKEKPVANVKLELLDFHCSHGMADAVKSLLKVQGAKSHGLLEFFYCLRIQSLALVQILHQNMYKVCAECAEDYCVGCFAKFHQKGALRFHHIIPMKAGGRSHIHIEFRDHGLSYMERLLLKKHRSHCVTIPAVGDRYIRPSARMDNRQGFIQNKNTDRDNRTRRRYIQTEHKDEDQPRTLAKGHYKYLT
ncbi:hypothetical protein QTP70_022652 [Hemibagrus guttatus]|uniref:ribonuclease H n=1 Tax=Hemibagrus guttatus TaxID=175788 RepID=A0AAE0VAQ5_9TELE|nr:hypothetical protein QTP70_022652 [Hemibagrus guttatus]